MFSSGAATWSGHDGNWPTISKAAFCANGMTHLGPGGWTEIKDRRGGRGGGRGKDNTSDAL